MAPANKIMNGWFSEICPMGPGLALSIEIDRVLHKEQSPFQRIEVFETACHGRMLVLDGMIQLTQFDEFAYQEMLAHLPMFAHPCPETVLVIGGGDGGVLREVSRHETVRRIDFCEIDEAVIRAAKTYLPDLACGFDDPRVRVHICDGTELAREAATAGNRYDVIIVDGSDPIGPGEALYEESFYQDLKQGLKPGGLLAFQGESLFLHPDLVGRLMGTTRELFPRAAYAWFVVPTYPGGHIGACVGSLGPDPATPARPVPAALQEQLRYYTPDIHRSAFVLPGFAERIVGGA